MRHQTGSRVLHYRQQGPFLVLLLLLSVAYVIEDRASQLKWGDREWQKNV